MLARLLSAAALARTADAGAGVVLVLASVRHTGGPAQGALVLGVLLVPHVLAGPFVGLVTDRSSRPRLVHAGFVAVFGAALGAVLLLTGVAPLPVVLGLALVAGGCAPMIFGGLSSRLDDVVPPARRPHARGLDAATYNVAEIAGPAAGALLVAVFGVPAAGVVLSGACLLAALVLVTVPAGPTATALAEPGAGSAAGSATPGGAASGGVLAGATTSGATVSAGGTAGGVPSGSAAPVGAAGAGSGRAGVRDGLLAIVRSRPLRAVTAATAVASLGAGMLTPVAVVLGAGAGHPAGGGLLVTALGVGALGGSLLVARFPVRFPPQLTVIACLAGIGVAFAGLAAVVGGGGSWPVLLVVFGLAGVLDGPLLSSVLQVRSQEAPPGTRTQVFTLGAGVKLTAASVGAAAFTLVAGASPVALAAVLAASHILAAALGAVLLLGRSVPSRR